MRLFLIQLGAMLSTRLVPDCPPCAFVRGLLVGAVAGAVLCGAALWLT